MENSNEKDGLVYNAKGDLIYQDIDVQQDDGTSFFSIRTNGEITGDFSSGNLEWVETGSGWVGSSAYTLHSISGASSYVDEPSEGAITSNKTFVMNHPNCSGTGDSFTFKISDSKGNTVTYDAYMYANEECDDE